MEERGENSSARLIQPLLLSFTFFSFSFFFYKTSEVPGMGDNMTLKLLSLWDETLNVIAGGPTRFHISGILAPLYSSFLL